MGRHGCSHRLHLAMAARRRSDGAFSVVTVEFYPACTPSGCGAGNRELTSAWISLSSESPSAMVRIHSGIELEHIYTQAGLCVSDRWDTERVPAAARCRFAVRVVVRPVLGDPRDALRSYGLRPIRNANGPIPSSFASRRRRRSGFGFVPMTPVGLVGRLCVRR